MTRDFPHIQKVNEELIERYVQYRSTLSKQEIDHVEALLKKSEPARRIAAFYRDYYAEKDRLDKSGSDLDNPSVVRKQKSLGSGQ